MNETTSACALCGLPLTHGKKSGTFGDQTLSFCCSGCLMVYTMLMAAADSPDPARFKESALYRRCVRAGVVPETEDALVTQLKGIEKEEASEAMQQQVLFGPEDALTLQLKVEGMWCPACAWVIQSALDKLPGIHNAVCDFVTDRLSCSYDPALVNPDGISDTIKGLGYAPIAVGADAKRSIWRGEFVRLMVCALLSANVMMLSWSLYSGFFTSLSPEDIRYISWPIFIMATGVMLYGGGHLFRKAWYGLRAMAPGMEALVCLGAGSAYLYSLINFFSNSWHLYFDTACMLITLVLLGKLLEAKAKARVRYDLEGFLALQPNKVRLCTDASPRGRFVALDQMAAGDRFRVKDGEMVAADGRIQSGQGLVDESTVTGEARPKRVGAGDSLSSGTSLIKGDITVTATRVGAASLLGQMITIIESSLAQRTPLESRTDRWLAMFVPVMVGVAILTSMAVYVLGMGLHTAFERGLTVLVIVCPCALGIAIPLARIGGISEAGRLGILVRDFEAFECAQSIASVVMDKTGTLTRGNWSLSQLAPMGDLSASHLLALAAGLEQRVDHAVARAVITQAQNQGIVPLPVEQVQSHDNGVAGVYAGQDVKFGTWTFVGQAGRPEPKAPLSKGPLSQVYLSVDQDVVAIVGFGDAVRKSVDGLIPQLKQKGLELHLISGDAHDTTLAMAEKIGIPNAAGGLLPRDKAAYVAQLRHKGDKVAMMGDGINDAPALAGADLSVALHRDAALAQQAAAVTLMKGDPAQLIDFFALAKRVNAKVGQNLGCAWIYNLISIPIAMSGLLNPLVAVSAMLLSSLTVIGNTLLLLKNRKA